MPARKKPQTEIALTKRRREIRKHRASIENLLGPIGRRLFREFLNLHGPLPIKVIACWGEALAQAFGKKGTAIVGKDPDKVVFRDLSECRGRFHGWGRTLLRRCLDLPKKEAGLCFVARIIEIENAHAPQWRGRLLVLYERTNGVVFHDLTPVKTPDKQSGDYVWRAVRQAALLLRTSGSPQSNSAIDDMSLVTVIFPARNGGKFVHKMFDLAVARLMEGEGAPWHVQKYRGLRPLRVKVESRELADFHRWLRNHSKNTTKKLASLISTQTAAEAEKNEAAGFPKRPAWLPLFPKASPYDY